MDNLDTISPRIPNSVSNTSQPKGKDKKHKKDKASKVDHDAYQSPYQSYQNESTPLLSNPNESLNGPKEQKKPKSKYDMKSHMANERTYFKYLFTGLHIGSIGTLVLTFFPTMDINKLYLVLFIWLIAFGFMFWGLYGYYRRKYLMENGVFKEANDISPHTPLLITGIFVFVIICVVCYGLYAHMDQDGEVNLGKLLLMTPKTTETSQTLDTPSSQTTQQRQQQLDLTRIPLDKKLGVKPTQIRNPTIATYVEQNI